MGRVTYRICTTLAFIFAALGALVVVLSEIGNGGGFQLIAGTALVLPLVVIAPVLYLIGWGVRWASGEPANQ